MVDPPPLTKNLDPPLTLLLVYTMSSDQVFLRSTSSHVTHLQVYFYIFRIVEVYSRRLQGEHMVNRFSSSTYHQKLLPVVKSLHIHSMAVHQSLTVAPYWSQRWNCVKTNLNITLALSPDIMSHFCHAYSTRETDQANSCGINRGTETSWSWSCNTSYVSRKENSNISS